MRSTWLTSASLTVPGAHHAGPLDDERDAVAPLVEVALQPAQRARAAVAEVADPVIRISLGPVVGREDHERVRGEPVVFQGPEDATDLGVGLHHEVAIAAGPRRPDELLRRHDRRVRRVERHVQEERPVLAAPTADPLDHPFREARDDGVEIPAPGHRPRTRLPGAFGGPGRDAQGLGGLGDDPVVLEPGVRGEVGHVIAEIGIEPVRQRAAGDRLAPVEVPGGEDPGAPRSRPRPAGRRASGCRPSSSRDATCRCRPSGSPGPAASRPWSARRRAPGARTS